MKLIAKWESRQAIIAMTHIALGSIPQLWITWKILANIAFMDRMSFHPGLCILIYALPGLLWCKICFRLACSDLDKSDRDFHREIWNDNTPMFFMIPLFQVHSGIFYLIRLGFVIIGRFILTIKNGPERQDHNLWRSENPYILIKPL